MDNQFRTPKVGILPATLLVGMGLLVTACNVHTGQSASEGIGFRTRFAQISAMRSYRQCRDDVVKLDTRKLGEDGSNSRYLASAKLFEKCEQQVGPDAFYQCQLPKRDLGPTRLASKLFSRWRHLQGARKFTVFQTDLLSKPKISCFQMVLFRGHNGGFVEHE